MISGVRASSTRIESTSSTMRVDVPALDHVLQAVLHVVAQIVEAELVVGAVGDVAVVGLLALLVVEPVHDDADREAEEVVDLSHPFGVALGQVVVDGDDVHAAAGERIEIDRKRGDQRLAFAGLHLGDLAFVQDHAADQLHVEMTLAERALGGFAHGGEGRHQNVVERGAVGDLLLEFVGARLQRVVGERFELLLQRVDLVDPRLIAADAPFIGGTKQLAGDGADHSGTPYVGRALISCRHGRICFRRSGIRHFSGKFDANAPATANSQWFARDRRGSDCCQLAACLALTTSRSRGR